MKILGVSAFYHDSAACLVVDGEIVAAAQEERFTRKKHDAGFPGRAAAYCLTEAGLAPAALDYVVFYEKPFLKFERLLETYLAYAPAGFTSFRRFLPTWVKEKLFQKSEIVHALNRAFDTDTSWDGRLLFSEHHLSHAASAFYPSPFDRAAVLTLDGVGEWTTTAQAVGNGSRLEIRKEIQFPHSLGLLYSAFTYYTGFKVNSGEYKVMGLAPYGEPRYAQLIRDRLIDIKDDGSFALDMQYFDYCAGLTMTTPRFHELFGGPPRAAEAALTPRDMDLAASIQVVTEEVVSRLGRDLARTTGEKNLCLAGGVALNCVANARLLRDGVFEHIWIQPASGDAGGALGAALSVYHGMLGGSRVPRQPDAMNGALLGPAYSQDDIERRLNAAGAVFTTMADAEMIDLCARAIADGNAVGWHQGRMEFGPRALGNRSILGDPRSRTMQRALNLKVKYRESFRPFAPSVLEEDAPGWFDLEERSPYMLLVADVMPERRLAVEGEDARRTGLDKLAVHRSVIPAVTHVDYSARLQTVSRQTNPRFHALISRFKEMTGCPVVVNTSFNVRGEPIVESPEDAFRCFMGSDIEYLCCGNAVLQKTRQTAPVVTRDESAFDAD